MLPITCWHNRLFSKMHRSRDQNNSITSTNLLEGSGNQTTNLPGGTLGLAMGERGHSRVRQDVLIAKNGTELIFLRLLPSSGLKHDRSAYYRLAFVYTAGFKGTQVTYSAGRFEPESSGFEGSRVVTYDVMTRLDMTTSYMSSILCINILARSTVATVVSFPDPERASGNETKQLGLARARDTKAGCGTGNEAT